MHPLKINLRIGGLTDAPSDQSKRGLEKIFSDTCCSPEWESNMMGWLLTHLAFILPTTYICYHQNFHLMNTKKATMHLMLDAIGEAHLMLKKLGYEIRPESEDELYKSNRGGKLRKIFFLFKTPAGKFVICNHCRNGVREMAELDEAFELLRKKSGLLMPAWDTLRNQ